MNKNDMPRILLYDIETLMNEGYFFSLYDPIGHNFITKEKSIITIAYKWFGEKEVHGISVADNPKKFVKNPHDDKDVMLKFIEVLKEADYIVGHYSDKFDNKFIQGRALINGLEPIKLPKQLDTYKLVKKHFNLNANRLDYIGKLLGFGGKMPMTWSYWVKVAKGDLAAAKKMMAYNKQDVVLLEKIFKKILPYVQTTLRIHKNTDLRSCPHCGHDKSDKRGFYYNISQTVQRLQCKKCRHYYSTKVIL